MIDFEIDDEVWWFEFPEQCLDLMGEPINEQ